MLLLPKLKETSQEKPLAVMPSMPPTADVSVISPPKAGVKPSGIISAKAKQAASSRSRSRTVTTFSGVAS